MPGSLSFIVKAVLGGLGTFAVSYVLFQGVLAVLAPLGWAVAFAAPVVVVLIFLAILPALGLGLGGLFNPGLRPYSVGVATAVAIQVLVPLANQAQVRREGASRMEARAIAPLSRAPNVIALACYNCYGVESMLVAATDTPVVIFPGQDEVGHRLTKVPVAQCSPEGDFVWEPALVQYGYIDWCLRKDRSDAISDGILFRIGDGVPDSIQIENFSGKVLSVAEFRAGVERPITFWEYGRVHVPGSAPFGFFFTRNVEVGAPFEYEDVIARMLGLPISDGIPEKPNRDRLAEAYWALSRLDEGDSTLRPVAGGVLRRSIEVLGPSASAPVIAAIAARLRADLPSASVLLVSALYAIPKPNREALKPLLADLSTRGSVENPALGAAAREFLGSLDAGAGR